MTSWSAAAVRLYITYVRKSKRSLSSPQETRDSIQELYLHPQSFAPPSNRGDDIIVSREDVNEWPLYRVYCQPDQKSNHPAESRRAMLYIHGGAYYREIDPFHWKLVFQIARDTGLNVIVPIYPLIPRPAATAAQVIPGITKICRLVKYDIVNITGDSAGGGITLAAMHYMLDHAPELAEKIKSLVIISPVLDMTFSHPEIARLDAIDPWLAPQGMREVITPQWAAGLATTDPIVSPLFGDLERLPRVLLFSGTDDILNADARRLSAMFQGKGRDGYVAGSVNLESFVYVEQEGMLHVYPLLPCWEGQKARRLLTEFLENHK